MRTLRLCSWLLVLVTGVAHAWPDKPIKFIVPSAAGGGDDFAARTVGAKMSELLGQPVVIENRAGAGGMIGQTYVAKSAPDGYTLLLAGGSMAGARFVNANVTYDLGRDFTPISLIEASPFVLVVSQTLPVRNVQGLVALAKSRAGKLTFATLGPGQIPWWSAAMFHGMAGVEAIEVPFKSLGDAITEVITGRVDYYFAPLFSALTNKTQLRVLAVTTRTRSDSLPEVPALAEAGFPGYDMPAWRSIMGPAGLKPDVVQVLNKAIVQAVASADVRERYAKAGSVAVSSTPEELRKRYEDWTVIFAKVAREAGVKPQ
jgi:tripartite-type tricarboxylate transporter receptor subunit TctC